MINKGNMNKKQRIYQIILPFIAFFIIISVCAFLLLRGVRSEAINMRILGDISTAYLLLLIIPSGLMTLVIMVTFIYLTNASSKWIRKIFPGIQSFFRWVESTMIKVGDTSMRPFISIESMLAIFKRKKNPKG